MKLSRHGLSIGIERIENTFYLTLKAIGKLTHADYEHINPFIDDALMGIKNPHLKAFIDGSDLEGWEPRAAWDDFKFGLKHGNEFEKIAIYGDKKWQERMSKVAGWFTSGESKYFDDPDEAWQWLHA